MFWGGETSISYSGGHAWVLDGYKTLKRHVSIVDLQTNEIIREWYQTKELVHCNFGWEGIGNGYYLSKAFNTISGPVMSSSENTEDETYGEKNNFQYNHKIIKEIKKL